MRTVNLSPFAACKWVKEATIGVVMVMNVNLAGGIGATQNGHVINS